MQCEVHERIRQVAMLVLVRREESREGRVTEQEVAEILEPLRAAEDKVLAAMVQHPDSYELHDCKVAIWKAMDKARCSVA